MLVATDSLNPSMGGPGVRPPLPGEVTVTLLKNQWPVTEDEQERDRRSIYLFTRRNLRYPLFDAFDRPDGNASCARRHVSTTAPQSLILLNSEFSLRMAEALAARTTYSEESSVETVWKIVLNRLPSEREMRLANSLLEEKGGELTDVCLALFNTNEFVWLD